MKLPERPWNGRYILDAYSCAGGATMGYYLAGYRVIAVDIDDQPNHPGNLWPGQEIRFIRADAVEYIRQYGTAFHAIHTSPPCQHDCTLTAGTNAHLRGQYADLLEPTRAALESTGRPYVIEQPPGRASRRMRVDLTLCGEQFGLRVIRHRNFEAGGGLVLDQPSHVPHRGRVAGMRHGVWYEGPYFAVYGEGGGKGSIAQWQDAMGMHWTSVRREIAEAIPPAYTEFIGRQLADHLAAIPAAA
nr:hypothetical protein KitaXyl93_20530 [Kitasatospora sp. Xyl93]